EPAGLGKGYEGITCIGAVIQGVKDGRRACKMIYNNCDHAKAFDETGAQAVSYTTGVPAMLGAKLMLQNTWRRPGVFNVEQLDPDPFLADMTKHGLPWHIVDWSQPIDDTAIVDHGPMGGDV
ncbi:MAG: saccharopine dehydrogenase C-terminal domain-containing protein, partial [Phycisphaeraceae bacterium]|nr:saccharopine dehydrogenase C-terminal domain-containing protein [Phycisphaeraceae bacterium]